MNLQFRAFVGASFLLMAGFSVQQPAFAAVNTELSGVSDQAKPVQLQTEQEKLSYTIGVDLGKNFKSENIEIDPTVIAAGIRDVIDNRHLALTEAEMKATLSTFQQNLLAKQVKKFKQMSEDNAKASAAFLAKNKLEKGVVVLPNGLQYKILKKGQGASPTANDTVTVAYEGKLVNGTVFDSTYERGKPTSFRVSEVIAGWQQALEHMKPGSEWMLYIPPKLAYGTAGAGDLIGPNEALIFKVELLKVDNSSAVKK